MIKILTNVGINTNYLPSTLNRKVLPFDEFATAKYDLLMLAEFMLQGSVVKVLFSIVQLKLTTTIRDR